jgi:protein disulfide isomerase family A protein 3
MLSGSLKPVTRKRLTTADKYRFVKVINGKTYDEIISDPTKDVLVQFCSSSFAECNVFAPKYEELARKLKDEDTLVIAAKLDITTVNDVPKPFRVKRFPTIYFVPVHSSPKLYEGKLEVDDLVRYVSSESTTPLKTVLVPVDSKVVNNNVKTEL